jgi:CRISPR/Cas system Type II protein with McrA/HNH and RuvC-like nuclease domain
LEDQNYRCPYTGILLKPGDNMSLDHILPTSRFPDLAGSIDNVEWVLDRVNLMKGNLTKEEFLQAVELIREVNTCK